MISVCNLAVEFGARPLFEDVSFVVNRKDRIALVGKNGAGKSTLLKILSGLQSPTTGVVAKQNGITIGYLPQVMVLHDELTVIEETEKAYAHVHQMQDSINRLETELSDRTDYESNEYLELVNSFSYENERFNMLGGLNYRATMERTLQGLGFTIADFDRPTKEFSGGWRMRIELAKLLLQQPDVLLLDEPTNHLDIESIRWLESFLLRSPGAVIVVSHDRAFINNVTNRTIEIACRKISDYKVGYDEFVKLRAERREQQLKAYENQQNEIAEIKDFIERFRYKPTKAVQVQSRIKQLEKIVPIEVDEVDNATIHLKFPACSRSGDYPVICNDVGKCYGSHRVFKNVSLTIERGEKVAFVGRNGEGKSTLVKCIMNEISFEGSLKLGHQVEIGYYAQNQAQLLNEELTVFETIDNVARGDIRLKIRDILGAFRFGGEASDKKVKVLSGGERSRLAMIKLLLEPVNLLILDEPTNHLDMRTKDVLKEAILAFDGTVIVVSHDRDFLNGLVSKVYEFSSGVVREHIGGIYDFLEKKEIESLQQLETLGSPSIKKNSQQNGTQSVNNEGKLNYLQQKEQAKKLRMAEKKVSECEAIHSEIEQQLAQLEEKMSTPEGLADLTIFAKHSEIRKKLEEAEKKWEQAMEELEALSLS